jgi:hypothetical protein
MAGVIETIQSLDSAPLKASYKKITIEKSFWKTAAPPSPYDIKAAMHVIRLLNESIELMRPGTITLPRGSRTACSSNSKKRKRRAD